MRHSIRLGSGSRIYGIYAVTMTPKVDEITNLCGPPQMWWRELFDEQDGG